MASEKNALAPTLSQRARGRVQRPESDRKMGDSQCSIAYGQPSRGLNANETRILFRVASAFIPWLP